LVTPRKWGGALPDRYMVRDGRVWDSDPEALDTPEEDDFFRLLGIVPTTAPHRRNGMDVSND